MQCNWQQFTPEITQNILAPTPPALQPAPRKPVLCVGRPVFELVWWVDSLGRVTRCLDVKNLIHLAAHLGV